MPFKTILVCLMTEHAADQILPTACRIAKAFEARLVGIHTIQALVPYPGIAMHIDHPDLAPFNTRMAEQNQRIKARFETHTAQRNLDAKWHTIPAQSPKASDQLVRAAFHADLVIVAQPDRKHERHDQLGAQKDLIINSGRPVLVIPPDQADKPMANRVLLAWNGTRESSTAAHGALPLLRDAEEVTVLTIASSRPHSVDNETEAEDVAAMLARHNVKAVSRHVEQTAASVGAQILGEARSSNCDLIVMGAFGQTRLLRLIFGDATHVMLHESDLPVLFMN